MRLVVVLVTLTVLNACSGDDGRTLDQTSPTAPDFSHLVKCEDYFGEGVTLRADAFDLAGCVTSDGKAAFYNEVFKDCADGRRMYWLDDGGWGFLGEPWHTEPVEPPEDVLASCRG